MCFPCAGTRMASLHNKKKHAYLRSCLQSGKIHDKLGFLMAISSNHLDFSEF